MKQIKEILESEVNILKRMAKTTNNLNPQVNLWFSNNRVMPVVLATDKDEWDKIILDLVMKFRPKAVCMMSEIWKHDLKNKTKQSGLHAVVWGKDEKTSWFGLLGEERNVIKETEDLSDNFESRWDFIQKLLE